MAAKAVAALLLLLLLAALPGRTEADNHLYAHGEPVVLWMNKVAPLNNPQETYSFLSLPFCNPSTEDEPASTFSYIGEILEGNHLVNSGMQLLFRVNSSKPMELCSKILSEEDAVKFTRAIMRNYTFECILDSLPFFSKVGTVVWAEEDPNTPGVLTSKVLIYTHMRVTVAFNDNVVIEVDLVSENLQVVEPGRKVDFTYEVIWIPTEKPFNRRFNRYFDYLFFEHQVHWFSVFNSLMMLSFLLGLLGLIYYRMTSHLHMAERLGDEVDLIETEVAWEAIADDVFRAPRNLSLLAACVGTGLQLSIVVLGLILSAILGSLFIDRGALVASSLYTQVFASFFAGFVAVSTLRVFDLQTPMTQSLMLTIGILPGIMASIQSLLIAVSSTNGLVYAPPLRFALIVLVYLVLSSPLILLGGKLAKFHQLSAPRHVSAAPRDIPKPSWPLRTAVVVCGGVLPFGAIFMEIFYLFSALWLRKFYYVWGFLFVNFVILLLISPCVSVIAVYVMFCWEDWRWPWIAFASAASIGAYSMLYGVYFFVFWTNMTGFLQLTFFFSYLTLFSVGIGLMCGAIGCLGALLFVARIFPSRSSTAELGLLPVEISLHMKEE